MASGQAHEEAGGQAARRARAATAGAGQTGMAVGFTLGLALVDAIPVLLFGVSMAVVGLKLRSVLFVLGAAASLLAGCGKVAWKLLLALRQRDVPWLNRQFRYLMGAGFALMLVAVVAAFVGGSLRFGALAAALTGMPACVFFALALCGFAVLGVMGARLDGSVARDNWAEQLVNTFAQAMLLAGIILC